MGRDCAGIGTEVAMTVGAADRCPRDDPAASSIPAPSSSTALHGRRSHTAFPLFSAIWKDGNIASRRNVSRQVADRTMIDVD